MNKNIRLLIEGFFDDEIFNVKNDIKLDIEDIGRYYDYQLGEIFYQNKKPYAVCCGDKSLFNDNKPRFCLLEYNKNDLPWGNSNKLVKELECFKNKYFYLWTFNDFLHIDEDGYENTLIIKNNYDISEFPAFKYCMELGDNVYLPAIDELLMLYLNKDKLKNVIVLGNNMYLSSTLYSGLYAYCIGTGIGNVNYYTKTCRYWVYPFYCLD